MREAPNIWLETGGFRTHRGIEYLSNAVGADRMVFGTKLPWQAVGPPHAELMYADIDDDARRAIGSSNLESAVGHGGLVAPCLATSGAITRRTRITTGRIRLPPMHWQANR